MAAPHPDIQPRAWQVKLVSNLAGGLNSAKQDYEIADEECSYCENLRFKHNRVIADTGYKRLGSANLMRGRVKGLFTHQSASGITTILAVTDLSVYQYVAAQDAWQYVRSSVGTTLVANEIAAATMIDVANTAGFAPGDFIGIDLDNGAQHQTTVAAITTPGAPGVIQITVGIPSAASIGRNFIKAVVLTGNNDNQVVWAAVPSHEWSVFTNGVNPPMRFDGTDCRVIPNLPSGGTLVCRTLVVFRDAYLILFNLVEGGINKPYKLVWCTAGDPTNWTTGDSGSNSLVDSRDEIIAAKPLVGDMVIYRSASFVIMEFVGLPFNTFRFTPINFGRTIATEGVGCVSENAVFAFTDVHLVLGKNRIYVYRGGDSTDTISDNIARVFFGPGGLWDRAKLHRAFVFHDEINDEVYFGACSGGREFPNVFAVLDLGTGKWRIRRTAHEFACAGVRPQEAGQGARIIDLTGTIAQQTWIIGGAGVPVGGSVILLGRMSGTNGIVDEYDLISLTDAGSLIPWQLVTKAFRAADRFMRVDWTEIECSGPVLRVHKYNVETGAIDIILTTLVAGIKKRFRSNKQFVHETIKYKISGTAAGTEITTLAFKYREESRWRL